MKNVDKLNDTTKNNLKVHTECTVLKSLTLTSLDPKFVPYAALLLQITLFRRLFLRI